MKEECRGERKDIISIGVAKNDGEGLLPREAVASGAAHSMRVFGRVRSCVRRRLAVAKPSAYRIVINI